MLPSNSWAKESRCFPVFVPANMKTPDGQYDLNTTEYVCAQPEHLVVNSSVLSQVTAKQVCLFVLFGKLSIRLYTIHCVAPLLRLWAGVIMPSYLPSTLIVLLLEADGPVIKACVRAVVHAEDNRPAQDHPWRATTHYGAEQGLAAGQG